jgi:lysophospholipase L1-like esterase
LTRFFNIINITVRRIIGILKLVLINAITFAVLLIMINWACGVYIKKSALTKRDELPNYEKDYAHAKAVFADYGRIKHRYEPFTGWKTLPYKGKTTNISKDGLRTHPGQNGIKGNESVIRFFGGSTMWGEGSDDEHTIPALFNASNPQYAVFNHAQLAYNTRQELDALITAYSRDEKTDIVIFYDGVNDAAFLCPKVITDLPAHRLVPMYREKLYTSTMKTVKELLAKVFVEDILIAIQRATFRPTPQNSPYDCTTNPEKAEAIAEIMMKNWEMAHEIVTARNGKFLAILQPAAFIGKPKTNYLKLDEDLGKNFQEIYARLKQKIVERQHPWIVDLSDKFDGDQYLYIDFCHVSPDGNQIMANEISKLVREINN